MTSLQHTRYFTRLFIWNTWFVSYLGHSTFWVWIWLQSWLRRASLHPGEKIMKKCNLPLCRNLTGVTTFSTPWKRDSPSRKPPHRCLAKIWRRSKTNLGRRDRGFIHHHCLIGELLQIAQNQGLSWADLYFSTSPGIESMMATLFPQERPEPVLSPWPPAPFSPPPLFTLLPGHAPLHSQVPDKTFLRINHWH